MTAPRSRKTTSQPKSNPSAFTAARMSGSSNPVLMVIVAPSRPSNARANPRPTKYAWNWAGLMKTYFSIR